MEKYKDKHCIVCGAELTDENIVWKNKANGVFRGKCKTCNNAYNRNHFHTHKHINRDIVDEFLSQGCCKCGESDKKCLDAHHINPEEKDYKISDLRKRLFSMEKLKAELDKCIVLCSNCHREFHYFQKLCGLELDDYLDESFNPSNYEEESA